MSDESMERPMLAPRPKSAWRSLAEDALGLGGLAALAIGGAMIYTPLAYIIIGLGGLTLCVSLSRRP